MEKASRQIRDSGCSAKHLSYLEERGGLTEYLYSRRVVLFMDECRQGAPHQGQAAHADNVWTILSLGISFLEAQTEPSLVLTQSRTLAHAHDIARIAARAPQCAS